jgi:hypothetical protein
MNFRAATFSEPVKSTSPSLIHMSWGFHSAILNIQFKGCPLPSEGSASWRHLHGHFWAALWENSHKLLMCVNAYGRWDWTKVWKGSLAFILCFSSVLPTIALRLYDDCRLYGLVHWQGCRDIMCCQWLPLYHNTSGNALPLVFPHAKLCQTEVPDPKLEFSIWEKSWTLYVLLIQHLPWFGKCCPGLIWLLKMSLF